MSKTNESILKKMWQAIAYYRRQKQLDKANTLEAVYWSTYRDMKSTKPNNYINL